MRSKFGFVEKILDNNLASLPLSPILICLLNCVTRLIELSKPVLTNYGKL